MKDIAFFRYNSQQSGVSSDKGPVEGVLEWKAPLGRQWYSSPYIDDGKVFVTCPNRFAQKLICLNGETGETIWEIVGKNIPDENSIPSNVRLSSNFVPWKDTVLVRALNSDEIYSFAKDDGKLLRKYRGNGFSSYRTHPAGLLEANETFMVLPMGFSEVVNSGTPAPKMKPWKYILCKDIESGEEKWRFRTGQFFSLPCVTDDYCYVGTYDGYFYCLYLESPESYRPGKWELQNSEKRIKWSFKANSPVNSSPICAFNHVYYGANDGIVYCHDAESGEIIWKYDTGTVNEKSFINFSKPLHENGSLYIGDSSNKLYCVDTNSGKLKWKQKTADWVRSRPIAAGNGIFTASMDSTIARWDPGQGQPEKVWERRLTEWFTCSDLSHAGKKIFVTTSDLVLWCLDMETGETVWKKNLVEYPDDWVAFDEFQSSPCVTDNSIFIGTPGKFLTALEKPTGNELWKFETGGEISSDPIYAKGRVYFGQMGGEDSFYCLDSENGNLIWKQNLGWIWSAPNYSDDKLFVPGVNGLAYCLDADSGHIIWSYQTDTNLYASPPIYNDLVFFGSWDHWLYAINIYSGQLAWKFDACTFLDSGVPAVHEDRLYLPTMGPHFYCLDAQNGNIVWRYSAEDIWSTNTSPSVYRNCCVFTTFKKRTDDKEGPYYINTTHCVDNRTGDKIWEYPDGGLNGPVIADDKVYFGSTNKEGPDFNFYCLDLTGNGDGTTTCLWKFPLGYTVLESCAAISDGKAFVYCEDGYLYCLK